MWNHVATNSKKIRDPLATSPAVGLRDPYPACLVASGTEDQNIQDFSRTPQTSSILQSEAPNCEQLVIFGPIQGCNMVQPLIQQVCHWL